MIQETNKNALEVAETGLHEFLVNYSANLDQDIILQLLQSHGKIDDCIRFAKSMKQHQKLIVHFINKGEYKLALDMILEIKSNETKNYEMIKHVSLLIKKVPIETLQALRSDAFRSIDIPKLMPALMGCPDDRVVFARKFVTDYCINLKKEKDSSVHNMSFYLFAKSENLEELVTFL